MKTAMQELIEYIELNPIVFNKELLLKLKELTFKEKEQIIDAYVQGGEDILLDSSEHNIDFFGNCHKYYNQTYNQNK